MRLDARLVIRRTTVALDEITFERVLEMARRQGRTFQECVNELLRVGLEAVGSRGNSPSAPLPVFDLGEPAVDLGDRDALYDLMERDA